MAKIGDTVRFLSSVGGGKIVKIDGQIAHVEEDDGFVTPVLLKELVVVAQAGQEKERRDIFGGTGQNSVLKPAAAPAPAPESKYQPEPEPEPFIPSEETDYGDRLSVQLAFMPVNPKELSSTNFEAYLVNDSNYALAYAISYRSDDSRQQSLLNAGIAEPNMQLFLKEIDRNDLGLLDHITLQAVAFKPQKKFSPKAPLNVEMPLDSTKFFKLHTLQPNLYFDEGVIALDFIKDDTPWNAYKTASRQPDQPQQQALRNAKAKPRPVRRRKPAPRLHRPEDGPLVTDLHINELLDNTTGMSPVDILNYQVDTFRSIMDQNLRIPGQRLIFIHGKGEGVLRQALLKELNHRYKGHDVQDASFREYGFGATQVTIRQHPHK